MEAEKRVLANAEKLYTAAKTAHELLYESEGAAETTLTAALKHVEELAKFDARFAEPAQQLAAAKAAVEDVSAQVRDFAEKVHASPERLEEIEDRLAALDRLKRKYGGAGGSQTLAEVMRFGEEAARRLAEVENRDELLAELKVKLEKDVAAYCAAAEKLTAARTAAAARLEKLATAEINDLAMTVRFKVQVTAEEEEANWARAWVGPGRVPDCDQRGRAAEAAGPDCVGRGDVAGAAGAEGDGGGELCRRGGAWAEEGATAYAANACFRRDRHWDWRAGGGGGGAELKTLARRQQVVCITHLPQIAAFADQHFLIEKAEKGGRMRTSVRRMEEGERAQEIARMLSGAKLTQSSVEHARSPLKSSR